MHLRAPLRRGARHAAVQKSGWVPTNAVSELDNERFLPMQNSLPEFPRVCKPRLHSFFTGICNYASEDNKVFIGPEEFSGIAKRDYRALCFPSKIFGGRFPLNVRFSGVLPARPSIFFKPILPYRPPRLSCFLRLAEDFAIFLTHQTFLFKSVRLRTAPAGKSAGKLPVRGMAAARPNGFFGGGREGFSANKQMRFPLFVPGPRSAPAAVSAPAAFALRRIFFRVWLISGL